MNTGMQNLVGLDRQELERLAQSLGKAPYRGRQLYRAIYRRRATAIAGLTDLDRDFKGALSAQYDVDYPRVQAVFASTDGSARYLLRLQDNTLIETVYMPEEVADDGLPFQSGGLRRGLPLLLHRALGAAAKPLGGRNSWPGNGGNQCA